MTQAAEVLRPLPDRRCRVMGIVNVTPDSFSDGGLYLRTEAAVERGRELAAQGADILDIGGESTRPGAERVEEDAERDRVLPVVQQLAAEGYAVSVDTMRASVAAAVVGAGAVAINDVSGGLADPEMLPFVAESGIAYVAMHWRGHADVMQMNAEYDDVLGEVRGALLQRVAAAVEAGVRPSAIAVDPGLGFAKTAEHNWRLLAGLGELVALGYPLVVGASRKAFLGALLAAPDGTPAPPSARDEATVALTTVAAGAGAWAVRVHEAAGSAAAVRVCARLGREHRSAVTARAGGESAPAPGCGPAD